jgi:hypothetical protein
VVHPRKQYSVLSAGQLLLTGYCTFSTKEHKILIRDNIWGVCGVKNSALLRHDKLRYQQVRIFQSAQYHKTKCFNFNFHQHEGLDVIKEISKGRKLYADSLTRKTLYEDCQ